MSDATYTPPTKSRVGHWILWTVALIGYLLAQTARNIGPLPWIDFLFDDIGDIAAVVTAFVVLFFTEYSISKELRSQTLVVRVIALGLTLGIASIYSLMSAPIAPSFMIMMLVILGIFPMAPFWALFLAIDHSRHAWLQWQRMPGLSGPGFVLALGLGLAVYPAYVWAGIIRHDESAALFQVAIEGQPKERLGALHELADLGPDAMLRTMASINNRRFFPGASIGIGPDIVKLPYGALHATFSEVQGSRIDEWRFPNEPPRLAGSNIQVEIDAEAAIATLSWTMFLENRSRDRSQEARMLLGIPPGSVAHNLELLIAGEMRSAAFESAAVVTNAYRTIALELRRDPALLLEPDVGSLDLRVFPVLPRSTQRVLVGLTIPLTFDDPNQPSGVLRLPWILSDNFAAEAKAPVDLLVGGTRGNVTLSDYPSSVSPEDLHTTAITVSGLFGSGNTRATAADKTGLTSQTIERVEAQEPAALGHPGGVLFAVEHTEDTQAKKVDWDTVLDALPSDTPVRFVVMGQNLDDLAGTAGRLSAQDIHALGGKAVRDLYAADLLFRALQLVGVDRDNEPTPTLVWVHGAHPFSATPTADVQLDAVLGEMVHFVTVSTNDTQRNRPLEALLEEDMARPFRRVGTLTEDLTALVSHSQRRLLVDKPLDESRARWRRVLEFRPHAPDRTAEIEISGAPLARLRAARAARALQRTNAEAAARLATDFRLVTAGSGATVLEQASDYGQFALDPNRASALENPQGSAAPELETWLALLIGAAVLGIWSRMRRHG